MQQEFINASSRLARRHGLSDDIAKLIASQWSFETGDSLDTPAPFNYGGVSTDENTGYARPSDEGGYYRAYSNIDEFAEDYYKRTIGAYGVDLNQYNTPDSWVRLLKDNGYFASDDVDGYTGGVKRFLYEYNGAVPELTNADVLTGDFAGSPDFETTMASLYQPLPHYTSSVKQPSNASFLDGFISAFNENGSIAFLRNAMLNIEMMKTQGYDRDFQASEHQKELVSKAFQGRQEIIDSILNNATSEEHLYRLMEMRRADLDLQEKVANSPIGVSTLGTVAGMLADPINFIPLVGQEAILGKALVRIGGKALAKIGTSRLAQAVEMGVTNGTLNVLDQEVAEKYGGYRANATEAFLLGAGAGAGLTVIRRLGSEYAKGKHMRAFEEDQKAIAERSLMLATDVPMNPNNLIPKVKADLGTLKEFTKTKTDNELAKYMVSNKNSKAYKAMFKEVKKDLPQLNSKDFFNKMRGLATTDKSYAEAITKANIIGGIPHSKDSVITHLANNAPEFTDFTVDDPRKILKETQGDLPEPLQRLGQLIERNGYTGDRFGQLVNSPSKVVREFAKTYLTDPRQRNLKKEASVELYKDVVQAEFDVHRGHLMDNYKDFVSNNPKSRWLDMQGLATEFNNLVTQASLDYGKFKKDISHYPKPIQEAVKNIEAFRKVENDTLKQAHIIKERAKDMGEIWRRTDPNKLNLLRIKFDTENDLKEFLKNYVLQAMDKEHLPKDLKPLEVAENWAKWHLNTEEAILSEKGDKFMSYYKGRVPMDTSLRVPLPDGTLFSYDTHLRDTDILKHMRYVSNRSAGAIALRLGAGIDDIGHGLKSVYDRAEAELDNLVEKGAVSRKNADNQLKDIRLVMHRLSGAIIHEDDVKPEGAIDKIKDILLTNSYAQNGMNFGTAQIGESIGAVSVAGARALTHFIPSLNKWLHDLTNAKYVTAEQLQHFKDQKLGYDLAEHIWLNPELHSVESLQAEQQGALMKALGVVKDGVDFGAKITSTLNQLTHMTNLSRNGIKGDIITDMIKWSRGDFNSFLRKNLFSERHLAEVGIKDVKAFQSDVYKYLGSLGDSKNALTASMQKWKNEDLHGYLRMLSFLETTANRAILKPTLGNGSSATDSLLASLFLQFKNFSRMALNGHVMRALSNWEREDSMMMLSSALSAGVIWAMRVRLNAETQYKNEKAKERYLKKTLTAENMLRAGFFRNSIGSGISYFNDIYEAVSGTGTIRTSVQRNEDTGNPITNAVMQTPAIASSIKTLAGLRSIGEVALSLNTDSFMSRGQSQAIERLFPLDRYVGLQAILAGLNDLVDFDKETDSIIKESKHKNILDSLR